MSMALSLTELANRGYVLGKVMQKNQVSIKEMQ